jgi:hypothetical protein
MALPYNSPGPPTMLRDVSPTFTDDRMGGGMVGGARGARGECVYHLISYRVRTRSLRQPHTHTHTVVWEVQKMWAEVWV